jgi:thioredoxin-dependent peroxiredoxin
MLQPAIIGTLPNVGAAAPQLRYVLQNKSNAELADLKGEVVLLFCLPSLDTSTCATETRTFNMRAAGLGAHVLVVSPDLPFAMKRFCVTEGISNVHTGSDFRFRDMSEKWGAAFAEGPYQGLHCRATWVVDREGIIRYHELTLELSGEPDYQSALNAVKTLL